MYYMYISPTIDDIKILSAKKAEYVNVLQKSRELNDKRDSLLTDFNSIDQANITKLSKIIPETFDPVLFLNDLSVMASKYAMAVKDFKISSPTSQAKNDSLSQKNDIYKNMVATFSVTGSFEQFVHFLKDVESSLRILDVTSLSITTASVDKISSTYTYKLEVHTYSLR